MPKQSISATSLSTTSSTNLSRAAQYRAFTSNIQALSTLSMFGRLRPTRLSISDYEQRGWGDLTAIRRLPECAVNHSSLFLRFMSYRNGYHLFGTVVVPRHVALNNDFRGFPLLACGRKCAVAFSTLTASTLPPRQTPRARRWQHVDKKKNFGRLFDYQ